MSKFTELLPEELRAEFSAFIPPMHSTVPFILDYLLHPKQQGLSMSSIHAHLVAISGFHPDVAGQSVFTNPIVGCFLKGLDRL